jgi:hypothetical protein
MEARPIEEETEHAQLWESLRSLRGDIIRLAQEGFDGSQRDLMMVTLLARIVQAELDYRAGPVVADPPAIEDVTPPDNPSSNGRAGH